MRVLPVRSNRTPGSAIGKLMQSVFDWTEQTLGLSLEMQKAILTSLAAILILVIARKLLLRVVKRSSGDLSVRYKWRKFSSYAAFAFGVIVVGNIWFRGFQSLSTYFGLLSAGIAIALQIPLVNLAGWFFILWRKPFAVGDRIEIGDVRGDVIDQRIFMFSMMEIGKWVDAEQSTGRIVHVPNGMIFSEALANYTLGFHFIWNEIPVLVTFESDWKTAKKLLSRIANEHSAEIAENYGAEFQKASDQMMIHFSALTPIVYTSVKDSGVLLTIRYLCDPRRRRGSEEKIWEAILEAFADSDTIDLAYPTQRQFLNFAEGKKGFAGKSVKD